MKHIKQIVHVKNVARTKLRIGIALLMILFGGLVLIANMNGRKYHWKESRRRGDIYLALNKPPDNVYHKRLVVL